eukprot:1879626-Amphidinium_carterae.1
MQLLPGLHAHAHFAGPATSVAGLALGRPDLALLVRRRGRRAAGPHSIKCSSGATDLQDWESGEPNYLPADHYWVALSGARWRGPDPEEWMRCRFVLFCFVFCDAFLWQCRWYRRQRAHEQVLAERLGLLQLTRARFPYFYDTLESYL